MGSFQQICLGGICLAAAYFFGNYVNNNPPLNSASETPVAGFSQFGSANDQATHGDAPLISGRIQSRLPISNFAPIENKPAPIATMKTPLKSRFAVPTIQTAPAEFAGPTGSQYNNPLPPPSQLTAPKQFAEPVQQPAVVFSENPFSSSPFSEPAAVSPTIQVPDFSAIAAEFKNTPIELPNMSRLGDMPSHSNVNRVEPNQFGNWHNPAPPNPQLKQLVRRLPDNGFRNPSLESEQPTIPQTPLHANVQQNVESWVQADPPQQGFSQADFEPHLKDNIFGLKPRPENRFEYTPEQNNDRLQSVSNSDTSDYQYDHEPPPVPPEPQVSEDRTEAGFRGNLTFRPAFENRSIKPDTRHRQADEPQFVSSEPRRRRQQPPIRSAPLQNTRANYAPPQSNPPGLPFRLTDQAKTELVQLRDRADSMIGLESTNFVDHTIKDGETLQTISARYFGSPNHYLDIYLANRNKLRNPADTRAGISIRVPVYEAN